MWQRMVWGSINQSTEQLHNLWPEFGLNQRRVETLGIIGRIRLLWLVSNIKSICLVSCVHDVTENLFCMPKPSPPFEMKLSDILSDYDMWCLDFLLLSKNRFLCQYLGGPSCHHSTTKFLSNSFQMGGVMHAYLMSIRTHAIY